MHARTLAAGAFALCFSLVATLAPAATLNVKPGADWHWALKAAKAGDVIQLAEPGDYLPITGMGAAYDKGRDPAQVVTVQGVPGAVMTGFVLQSAGGYLVRNVEVRPSAKPFRFQDSWNITVDHVKVYQAATATPDQVRKLGSIGLYFEGGWDLKVINSEFVNLGSGVSHRNTTRLTVEANLFHNLSQDGVRGDSSNITINGNTCTDFYAAQQPDGNRVHFDCIQQWTAGVTTPRVGVRITNNRAIRGAGDTGKGLQIGDEADRGQNTGKPTPWPDVKVGHVGILIQGNQFGMGGNCMNLEGLVDALVQFNACFGTAADTHPVSMRQADGSTRLVDVVIPPLFRCTNCKGGTFRGNAGPGLPSQYRTILPATLEGNVVIKALFGKAGDFSAAEAWWAGSASARTIPAN